MAAITTSAAGRAAGISSLDYNDLVALMSRCVLWLRQCKRDGVMGGGSLCAPGVCCQAPFRTPCCTPVFCMGWGDDCYLAISCHNVTPCFTFVMCFGLCCRVASPGFLNFMQQFLLIYEQQSCCSAADLAAVAAAMAGNAAAGASAFHTAAAVATPRASRSSSTGRSRTPRQHVNRGTAGGVASASTNHSNASTPAGPGMLAHLSKQPQQQQPQHCSLSNAQGVESAIGADTAEANGSSSSGRRTGRRKGPSGRPAAPPF